MRKRLRRERDWWILGSVIWSRYVKIDCTLKCIFRLLVDRLLDRNIHVFCSGVQVDWCLQANQQQLHPKWPVPLRPDCHDNGVSSPGFMKLPIPCTNPVDSVLLSTKRSKLIHLLILFIYWLLFYKIIKDAMNDSPFPSLSLNVFELFQQHTCVVVRPPAHPDCADAATPKLEIKLRVVIMKTIMLYLIFLSSQLTNFSKQIQLYSFWNDPINSTTVNPSSFPKATVNFFIQSLRLIAPIRS